MKAMQIKAFGGLEPLRRVEVPPPEPGPNQILVEVAATSVNPIDWKLRSGLLRWIAGAFGLPATPCLDFAGEVKATGPTVADFTAGDRVFGMLSLKPLGAAAEFLVVDASHAALMPPTLGYTEAAGLPLAGMTAWQALREQGRLQPGQRVLVIGAAGGVGHYAVQIAKAMEAQVTGVCGTWNIELVRSLGADEILDYTRDDWNIPRAPFDVILDTVMNRPFSSWQTRLTDRGVYVSLLPKPSHVLQALTLPLHSRQRLRITSLKPNRAALSQLGDWVQQGRLRTVIDSVYSLEELPAALRKSQSGRARGKIIVSVKG
jgi:NADPH:quinone reductase-like Zn-dependent oxidoreductase